MLSVLLEKATECHRNMCTDLGTNVGSYDTVVILYENFKNKDYDIQ